MIHQYICSVQRRAEYSLSINYLICEYTGQDSFNLTYVFSSNNLWCCCSSPSCNKKSLKQSKPSSKQQKDVAGLTGHLMIEMERLSTQMAHRRHYLDTLLLNNPHTHPPNRTPRFWDSDNCNLRSVPMHRGYRVRLRSSQEMLKNWCLASNSENTWMITLHRWLLLFFYGWIRRPGPDVFLLWRRK